jgi:hypothetical protein
MTQAAACFQQFESMSVACILKVEWYSRVLRGCEMRDRFLHCREVQVRQLPPEKARGSGRGGRYIAIYIPIQSRMGHINNTSQVNSINSNESIS